MLVIRRDCRFARQRRITRVSEDRVIREETRELGGILFPETGQSTLRERAWKSREPCASQSTSWVNTTFMTLSHPDYTNASTVVGRGIAGYTRIDVEMD